MKWKAREVREVDTPSYKKLLMNEKVTKYYYQGKTWSNDEVEAQINE